MDKHLNYFVTVLSILYGDQTVLRVVVIELDWVIDAAVEIERVIVREIWVSLVLDLSGDFDWREKRVEIEHRQTDYLVCGGFIAVYFLYFKDYNKKNCIW